MHGVALFYRVALSELAASATGTEKPRVFQGSGLLVAVHVRRSGLPRALRARGAAGIRDVLTWRLAVRGAQGDAWRDLRTVCSTAPWRRLWSVPSPVASFRFRSGPGELGLAVHAEGRRELELEARAASSGPSSVLGHRTCAEAELFGDPAGCRDLIRRPLGLERLEIVTLTDVPLPGLGAAEPDSVYRITERRLVGDGSPGEVVRDTRTAPFLPTPS